MSSQNAWQYTYEHLAALREAMASGELVVQFNGRRIQYRSLAEMERMEAKILKALGMPGRRRNQAIFNKGL